MSQVKLSRKEFPASVILTEVTKKQVLQIQPKEMLNTNITIKSTQVEAE